MTRTGARPLTARDIRQRVAVALQRGNAWVIQQGERLALAARGEDYVCVWRGGRRGRPPTGDGPVADTGVCCVLVSWCVFASGVLCLSLFSDSKAPLFSAH